MCRSCWVFPMFQTLWTPAPNVSNSVCAVLLNVSAQSEAETIGEVN